MKLLVLSLLVLTNSVFAVSLKDYKPYQYEVLFTNPECALYSYDGALKTNDGDKVNSKPKNVYCKNDDQDSQYKRETSPHNRIVDFITDTKTKEIFLAYLSFSNEDIISKLCSALKKKVKMTLIIDEGMRTRGGQKLFDTFTKCAGGDKKLFIGEFRGGKKGLGYAHNKIIIINPKSKNTVKIVYGSGNMSTGTNLHHENWHFVTTNIKSYFAQSHLCVMNGMLKAGDSKKNFISFMATCRAEINSEEEEDIKVFFVPGEGERAMAFIKKAFRYSKTIDMAAHRFTNKDIMAEMMKATEKGKKVRFVVDDDIYWSGVLKKTIGLNMLMEYYNVNKVRMAGTDVRYMETNQGQYQLHHNKYFIFNSNSSGSVFTGAGNMTKAAFTKNFENFYYITIPEVVESFNKQYTKIWTELATPYEKMPTELVMP